MPQKPHKKFDKLSYGAIALYVAVMIVLGGAVYGINITSGMMDQNRSDRDRARMQSGRMVIVTEDRTQCRTLRFDNDTAELGRETLVDCDPKLGLDSGGSFNFMKR